MVILEQFDPAKLPPDEQSLTPESAGVLMDEARVLVHGHDGRDHYYMVEITTIDGEKGFMITSEDDGSRHFETGPLAIHGAQSVRRDDMQRIRYGDIEPAIAMELTDPNEGEDDPEFMIHVIREPSNPAPEHKPLLRGWHALRDAQSGGKTLKSRWHD